MSCPCRATRFFVLAAIVVGLVGCDQATKVYAFKHLKDQPRQSYLGDMLRIEYVPNTGAFLGLLSGADPSIRFWTLTVGNGLILAWVMGFVVWNRKLDRWAFTGLALIAAGGIGNFIDRARLDYVIDFLNLGIGNSRFTRTGIFNVADVAITVGFFLLAPMMFRKDAEVQVASPATGVAG